MGMQVCIRCGNTGHEARACTHKSFFGPQCSWCKCMGHAVDRCPIKGEIEFKTRQAAREKREKVEAALQEREAKTALRLGQSKDIDVETASCDSVSTRASSVASIEFDEKVQAKALLAAEDDKDVKKLKKKLREIDALQERFNSGEKLEKLQQDKLNSKGQVEVELSTAVGLAAARA